MSERRPTCLPPFPQEYRASGLLLHVTSLPSPYGIGDLGPSAFRWVDRLHEAGQSWWQALPLGPTGYSNSPYQPLSSFAANGLLISPDLLIEEGLLERSDCRRFPSGTTVDYNAVIPFKHRLIERAWANFKAGARSDLRNDFDLFCDEQAYWLQDYALFRVLKGKYEGVDYLEWPRELLFREPAALVQARAELEPWIEQVCFAQFMLFRQWTHLKNYANDKGVYLIGDMPFFASPDSSDVWLNPELFLLDDQRRPQFVAGVPPDYFSVEGQLWGNPVYNWDALRQTHYCWWTERIRALLNRVDVIRLDHFRAFSAAWHVLAGATTARSGQWILGPGVDFFSTVEKAVGGLPFICEDLGVITPDVYVLRNRFNMPGMRVLQFAFDGRPENPHLPHHYGSNTVAYTGTHDNPTARAWYEELPDLQRQSLWNYLKRPAGDSCKAAPALMQLAWSSPAALAIAPLQDVLNLGEEARMNIPGRAENNWRWRCTEEMLSSTAFQCLRKLTEDSGRLAVNE